MSSLGLNEKHRPPSEKRIHLKISAPEGIKIYSNDAIEENFFVEIPFNELWVSDV